MGKAVKRLPQTVLVGAAVGASVLALLIVSARADALVDGAPYVATNPQNIAEASRVPETFGAYDVPGTPASPGSVGSGATWSIQEYQALEGVPPPGTSVAADALETETPRLGRILGLLPKLSKFKFFMGGLAGTAAWYGGSYLVGKIFSPADTPAGLVWNLSYLKLLDFYDTVDRQCYASVHCTDQTTIAWIAPRPYRLFFSTSNQKDFYYCAGPGAYNSPETMVGAIPEGASVQLTYTEDPTGVGTCGWRTWQHFSIISPIAIEELWPPGAPIGTGTPQIGSTTTYPCTPDWGTCPTSSNIQQKVADELNTGNEPTTSAEKDHQAEPLLIPDPMAPTTDNANNHRCDLSPPNYRNPGGNTDPPPMAIKDPTPFITSGRPPGYEGAPDPYLRFGSAEWLGAFQDQWNGWGWRHIQAKHGWTVADETATRDTLFAPAIPPVPAGTRMEYTGADYVQNGALCARRVVVEYQDDMGIWTSYGRLFGEAP